MSGTLYIAISQFFVGIMLGSILLIAWRTMDSRRYPLTWSIAFFIGALSNALNAIRPWFPTVEVYWITVNALSIVVTTLAYVGFRQRAKIPIRSRMLMASGLLVLTCLSAITIGNWHFGLQVALNPYYTTLLMTAAAAVLLRNGPNISAAEWGMVAVLLIFGTAQLVAGTVVLVAGPVRIEPYVELYNQLNFLTLPWAYTGMGLFAVLLIANDLSDRMKTLAVTDSLTGFLNRRGFFDEASRVLSQANRKGHPVTVVAADIDHFKAINDKFGHAVGDEALREFARRLSSGLRAGDVIGRLGGEEFAIVMPETKIEDAAVIAERLRKKIEESALSVENKSLTLTSSFGLASSDGSNASVGQLLEDADRALYDAKQRGRNRVQMYSAT